MGCSASLVLQHAQEPQKSSGIPAGQPALRACAHATQPRAVASSQGANLKACEAKLSLLDRLVSGEADDLDEGTADEEIGDALDTLQGLLQLTQRALPTAELDLQALQLPSRGAAEAALARYSRLGSATLGLASHAISALPFGAPVAAVLKVLCGHAVQVGKNSKNCGRLLELVKQCDMQMKKLAGAKQCRLPDGASGQVRKLGVLLVRAGLTVNRYGGRHFILRFVMSGSDMETFQRLEADISRTMLTLSMGMVVLVITDGGYMDESKELRAAVCKAAGLPEGPENAVKALKKLRTEQPQVLKQLLHDEGGFPEQVVRQALEILEEQVRELKAEVVVVKADMVEVKSRLDRMEAKQQALDTLGPTFMPKWLWKWWQGHFKDSQQAVPESEFLSALVSWFADKGLSMQVYDEKLDNEGLLAQLEDAGPRPFLRRVVLPLLDSDHDSMVARSELLLLEHQYGGGSPIDMQELLDAVYTGFDRKMLAKAARRVDKAIVGKISRALQVKNTMRSYGIPTLQEEYLCGSRQWMYDEVDEWLASTLHSDDQASRLLLLLAEAGMGKSVFSAVMDTKLMVRTNQSTALVMVRHFFKVGQPRAQGKSAVLCLTQQLSEQLPGFAELLLPVVEEHGDASAQSMLEAFDSFLLGPLQALDKALAPDTQRHCVLIVLDALDESDDGGSDWQPVTNMIAKEFLSLPQWVKVLVTGRPQVEPAFKAWDPVWIKAENSRNLDDLLDVLRWRLEQSCCVLALDTDAAANLLLRKSGGQFIYSNYVFAELAGQETWTLAEMERLPYGLHGMFRRVMDTLCDALRLEAPDMLVLLLQQLLPVLVAAREPLTVNELTWVVAGEEDREEVGKQVSRLVRLLAPLFPTRLVDDGGEPRVVPYHKSVLDWLDPASMDRDGPRADQKAALVATRHAYCVDAVFGHRLLGQAAAQLLLPTTDKALNASSQQRSCESHQLCAEEMPVVPLLGGRYSLHHAAAHLCLAAATSSDSLVAQLHKLALHPGFWQQVFGAGFGLDVTRDMILLGPGIRQGPGRSWLNDAVRWLRGNSAYLALYPRAALQFATDAPSATMVAKAAMALSYRPPARLMTKAIDWPEFWATFLGHTDAVSNVAFSPDGKTIVSGSWDKTVRVWDTLTGQQKIMLEGHNDCVSSVAISPDGKTIVSGSDDKTVRVWDTLTAQQKRVLEGHTNRVSSVAISPDGKTIVSGSYNMTRCPLNCIPAATYSGPKDTTVRVWDALTGQQESVLQGHTDCVSSVAISPDGKTIVSGSDDKTVRVWDALTGQQESMLEGHTNAPCRMSDKAVHDRVQDAAISPDGKTFVSMSRWLNYMDIETTVMVWDLQDGVYRRELLDSEADAMWASVQARSPSEPLIAQSTGQKRQVVELSNRATKHLTSVIYIAHRSELKTETLQLSSLSKRAAMFTDDDTFLCYELLI